MRAQLKVVLLVAFILVFALGTLVWKTNSVLTSYASAALSDSSMKQIAPLKRLVSERIETEKNDLIRFATSREAQGPGKATGFGAFDAVALVERSQGRSDDQWVPTWIEKGPGVRADGWPQGYELTLLKSLPFARVKDGGTLWVRLSDSQGAPLYAVLNSVEIQTPANIAASAPAATGLLPDGQAPAPVVPGALREAVIVGFASDNPLASVTEDYIGSTNLVYLVDDRGYVASHVKRNFLGSSFSEDPITKDLLKSRDLTGTRNVRDLDGEKVIAHFERIDRTNLAAVIATPQSAASALSGTVVNTILTVGGGVSILALLLAWFIGGTLTPLSLPVARARSEELEPSTVQPEAGFVPAAANPPNVVSQAELAKAQDVGLDRLRTERKNAFEAFNAGLAARLREPLLAILGHAQLAKSKSTDDAVTAHADSIEREARLAKDAIERFQVIEESTSLGRVSETCDLEKTVLSALAEKAVEIEGSGITLEKHISHVPQVRGRTADLEALIVHLLENSVEALRDRPMKKITVHVSWLKDTVRLLISDSGIGMSRDVKDRAFEPFFKAFEAPRHMGLGLAFVQSTVKRVGGTVELESSPGEGSVFTIEFPVEADARKDFEAKTAPPDLQKINESIESFTLGGRKPLPTHESFPVAQAPKPSGQPSMSMSPGPTDSSTSQESEPGFRVQIRRPKPRG